MSVEVDRGYPAIRARHLWHRYGTRQVLHDVTFDVHQGEIFGFIGPNGAGKTTTIRIMSTLARAHGGSSGNRRHRRDHGAGGRCGKLIGYMPDHAGVYERITVREYLEFFADAYRIPSLGRGRRGRSSSPTSARSRINWW